MKVLLIEDVDNLGYAGDIKEVKNGYGRNYLLPQSLAILATPGAMKQAETIRKAAEKVRAQERSDAEAIANQISGLEFVFERRAGETGKLYGSVTSGDIAEAILEKTGIEIDKRKVALAEPMRSLGKQDVTIKLMIDLSTTVEVEVLPLGGILERERLSEAEAKAAAEEAAAALEAQTAAEAAETATETETDITDTPSTEQTPTEVPSEETPETPAVASSENNSEENEENNEAGSQANPA